MYALIDRLASWKVNQVQLYSEHTFAYRNHPEVHADASPFTADEIRELDAFCRERHVELVPNQNCLGHMNRWLLARPRTARSRSRPTASSIRTVSGHEAMTIDPAHPGSLALVRELLGELLPLFSSRRVNIGLDETWELPPRTARRVLRMDRDAPRAPRARRPRGDHLGRHVLGRCRRSSRRLPDGVTVCEWGYDAEYPFDERRRAARRRRAPVLGRARARRAG